MNLYIIIIHIDYQRDMSNNKIEKIPPKISLLVDLEKL